MNTIDRPEGFLAGFLFPHPPVIVPSVGHGKEKAAALTIEACALNAGHLADTGCETLILVTPHAPLYRDYVWVYDGPELTGSFGQFGASETVLTFAQDTDLRSAIIEELSLDGIEAGSADLESGSNQASDQGLDHGALVPLFFIRKACSSLRLVVLSAAALGLEGQLRLGRALHRAVLRTGRKACLVASGDLSHRVHAGSPYGAVPEGLDFDRELTGAIRISDWQSLLSIDPLLRERAGECGYGPLVILCGAFPERTVTAELLSYEAPFGIGYAVASFRPGKSDPRVRLARLALERFVRGQGILAESDVRSLFPGERAGVFVSIKKAGALRGCIGTIVPTASSLAAEIIQNAISAATRDPRFEPIGEDELDLLDISVDVLGQPVAVSDRSALDPALWGVIVTSHGKRGLLLPDLAGVDTVDAQLGIACRKAGIRTDEPFDIEKFSVTRYR